MILKSARDHRMLLLPPRGHLAYKMSEFANIDYKHSEYEVYVTWLYIMMKQITSLCLQCTQRPWTLLVRIMLAMCQGAI